MKRRQVHVLGVFPPLSADLIGGVQTSGRVAWRVVAESPALRGGYLFCAGPVANGTRPWVRRAALVACAKGRAVIEAVRTRWSARLVLVWHLAFLKLLPFFRMAGGRVVVYLHGTEAWRRQDWVMRRLLRRVDLFLSNSDYTWRRFTECNPEVSATRHRTVHLGVGSPLRGATPPPGPVPVALMLGRLVRSEDYKGHRETIVAWPLVLERVPGAELWIVGDGDLRPDLEGLARGLGCPERVRFWGRVPEAQKEDLLARSRCLALPSRGEGFGLVYLEAMRLGRPCLVSGVDAGREVVNPPEAGLAVDPRDRAELAEAIGRLLTPGPEWERWSEQARRRYERAFSAAHFQERLVAALTDAEPPSSVAAAEGRA